MPMPDFALKQGDRLPPLTMQLFYSDGTPVNLVGNLGLRFTMRRVGATVNTIESSNVTVIDPPTGQISYSWEAGSTDQPGDFFAECAVYDGAKWITVPTKNYIHIAILPSFRTQ